MKKSKIGTTLPAAGLPQAGDMLGNIGPAPSELNLANHFLIAMPTMDDPIFGGAVVYVCEHNEKGVLGVVINKPTDMTMEVLFDRIDLKVADSLRPAVVDEPIMFGGPVQDDRGFVLHSPSGRYSSSLNVTDEVAFTTVSGWAWPVSVLPIAMPIRLMPKSNPKTISTIVTHGRPRWRASADRCPAV